MGVEIALILSIGSTLLVADQVARSAQSEAKATVAAGDIAAENKAKQTRLRAARQQLSFINSGLTLEGTPMAVLEGTFATGLEDIQQIQSNAQTTAKNALRAGRTQVLSGLAQGAAGAFGGGGFGGGGGGGSIFSGGGFTVPFTGSSKAQFGIGGVPIPGTKPTRINF